jgi:hypothetical protein
VKVKGFDEFFRFQFILSLLRSLYCFPACSGGSR